MDTIDYIKVKAFIDEIIEVSKKHELSIGHEDSGGGFIFRKYNKEDEEWFKDGSYEL